MSRERAGGKGKMPVVVLLLVSAGLLLLAGANAHLVHVALRSEPGCVPHLKEPGSVAGEFRAAKSAC